MDPSFRRSFYRTRKAVDFRLQIFDFRLESENKTHFWQHRPEVAPSGQPWITESGGIRRVAWLGRVSPAQTSNCFRLHDPLLSGRAPELQFVCAEFEMDRLLSCPGPKR